MWLRGGFLSMEHLDSPRETDINSDRKIFSNLQLPEVNAKRQNLYGSYVCIILVTEGLSGYCYREKYLYLKTY